MKLVSNLMFIGAAMAAMAGCSSYRMAVVSNQGSAYVLRAGMFGSEMYRCTATGGTPVCTAVVEQ